MCILCIYVINYDLWLISYVHLYLNTIVCCFLFNATCNKYCLCTIIAYLIKSCSTEKLEVRGQTAIYIWSVWIFLLFSVVFGWSYFRFLSKLYGVYPLTSGFSVELDFKICNFCIKILKILKDADDSKYNKCGNCPKSLKQE